MEIAQQLLREADIFPTDEVIAQCLGKSNHAYKQFVEGLKQFDITLMEWQFYNDGKAWLSKGEYKYSTPRGTQKVIPLFWLSIWEGFFKITFFFAASLQEELLNLPISAEAKKIIKDAKPMGKSMRFTPLIFEVKDSSLLEDLYTLSQFRKTKMK